MLRRIRSVIKATTLEVVSEPLFFLLTLTAVGVVTVASLLHVHQFGEPSRMARDVGLSSVLIFGIVFAVFASIRVFRREIDSSTIQMALSRPISREMFFFSKTAGAFAGYICFFIVVFASSVTMVVGAEAAKAYSRCAAVHDCGASGENLLPETVWGVSLAINVAVMVVPLILGAFLNRFFRFRFTMTAFVTAVFVSVAGCVLNIFLAWSMLQARMPGLYETVVRLIPVGLLLIAPAAVFLTLASSLSVRLKENAVSSLSALFFLLFIPALGNYYQSQALSRGGELSWSYVAFAFAAILPIVFAFLLFGAFLMRSKDVG